MRNLLKLKMREYRQVCMLACQSALNALLGFDGSLSDGCGCCPQGGRGRLTFDRCYLARRVIALDLLLS